MIDYYRANKVSHLLIEAIRCSISQKRQLQLPVHPSETIPLLISTDLDIEWLNQSAYAQILHLLLPKRDLPRNVVKSHINPVADPNIVTWLTGHGIFCTHGVLEKDSSIGVKTFYRTFQL